MGISYTKVFTSKMEEKNETSFLNQINDEVTNFIKVEEKDEKSSNDDKANFTSSSEDKLFSEKISKERFELNSISKQIADTIDMKLEKDDFTTLIQSTLPADNRKPSDHESIQSVDSDCTKISQKIMEFSKNEINQQSMEFSKNEFNDDLENHKYGQEA